MKGNTLLSLIRKLVADENGATAIEYGLIAAMIAIAIIGVLRTVGVSLVETFMLVGSSL